MINVLLIDNYDSFVYNVKQLLDESGLAKTTVLKNDQISVEAVSAFDCIVISPGPGIPSEIALIKEIISHYKESKPILGICLGFQAIGEVFGAQLIATGNICHGHESNIHICSPPDGLFHSIESPFRAGRYHSWILDRDTWPEQLQITTETEEGIVMSYTHRQYNIRGVLFHPESIMTPEGGTMIFNWLTLNQK